MDYPAAPEWTSANTNEASKAKEIPLALQRIDADIEALLGITERLEDSFNSTLADAPPKTPEQAVPTEGLSPLGRNLHRIHTSLRVLNGKLETLATRCEL